MAVSMGSNGRNTEKRFDLVLEGGGIKGLGLVGALAALEDGGYQPQNIAGTSVGAIVGALLAAGYSSAEMHEIMMYEFDFQRFKDLAFEGQLPLIGKPLRILCNLGIYEGKVFERQMEKWLEAKNVRTFKDLRWSGEDAEEMDIYRYKLQVITSDLTDRRMLVLPRDAHHLGFKPDRLSVAKAVRMSMSVPIFFKPVEVAGPGGVRHVLVDGALLSNFPIWIFDSEGVPSWPTFGLHLVNAFEMTGITDRIPPIDRAFGNPSMLFRSYLLSLAMTALEAHDWQYIERGNFARTIPIPTLGVGVMDFGISKSLKEELYQSGYDAGKKFLEMWDFEGYIEEFRSGKQETRTESIAKQLKQRETG